MKRLLGRVCRAIHMERPYKPAVITCALTGNVPTREMNPNLPVAPEEIAEAAIGVYEAGASIVHIHVRDDDQLPTQDLDVYRRVVEIVKAETPDLILQLTTGGRSGKSEQLRLDVIRLGPEMGSFTTGSNNLAKICYENNPDFLVSLAKVFHDTGVKPEIECFDTGHIDNAIFLAEKKGLLDFPLHFNFVLGAVGAAPGSIQALTPMLSRIPDGCTWTATGLAWSQFDIVAAALALGGNVRVGMEDFIYMPDGSMASNRLMVEKVVRMAEEMNREIATPAQAREILSMDPARRDLILDYAEFGGPIMDVDLDDLSPIRQVTTYEEMRIAQLQADIDVRKG